MKIRALALALALALAAPAAPALAASPPSPRAAAIVLTVGPVRALRLMNRGWWCERTAPGRFRCTNADLDPYFIFGPVTSLDGPDGLWFFLRHDSECAGDTWHPGWYECTDA